MIITISVFSYAIILVITGEYRSKKRKSGYAKEN
jgi:hypothetical protein